MDAWSDVLRRLDLLEAERAIVSTIYRYAHSIDYGREDDWVDCFTPDGVFEIQRRVPGNVTRIEGQRALRAFIAKHTRAPVKYHKHCVLEPVISIEASTAFVQSYFTTLESTDEGVPLVRLFGRYRDRMHRGADGRWRFTERLAEVEALLAATG